MCVHVVNMCSVFINCAGEYGAAEEGNVTSENGAEIQDDSVVSEGKAGKFNWGATIIAVLESKGEISVKKLRKKVSPVTGCCKGGEVFLIKCICLRNCWIKFLFASHFIDHE